MCIVIFVWRFVQPARCGQVHNIKFGMSTTIEKTHQLPVPPVYQLFGHATFFFHHYHERTGKLLLQQDDEAIFREVRVSPFACGSHLTPRGIGTLANRLARGKHTEKEEERPAGGSAVELFSRCFFLWLPLGTMVVSEQTPRGLKQTPHDKDDTARMGDGFGVAVDLPIRQWKKKSTPTTALNE